MGLKKIVVDIPEDDPSMYEMDRRDKNNFSFWFPKVENCGIKVPRSVVLIVPEEITHCFFMERKTDADDIAAWVRESVMPAIKDLGSLLFIKNGGFSNKFDFRTCATRNNLYELVANICMINYQSLCFDTGGETELVIRQRIGWSDGDKCYHIYNGMPLRPEFRVFYDFDRRKVLYSVNYWDYDHCNEAISRDMTDGLAYNAAYHDIDAFFKENQKNVETIVDQHMSTVSGLDGIWSVDIMWYDNDYWLIDMAIGSASAYYDPKKCGISGGNEGI